MKDSIKKIVWEIKKIAFAMIIIATLTILTLIAVVYYSTTQNKTIKESTPEIGTTKIIEGNKDDLVSFSVSPGDKISGVLNFNGIVRNAYFFEANILVNIIDTNKKLLKAGYGMATTEWMTSEPVSFSGNIDLSGLTPGPGYIQIANDNPSDIRANDKFIYIPIIIGP